MFWNNVKTLLLQKNIHQKDFAELLGVNVLTLKNQMSRNILPDVVTAHKIATELNTTVEFLVSGKEREITKSDVIAFIEKHTV